MSQATNATMATTRLAADPVSDSTSRQVEGRLRVAYVLHRFPYLTETFIMHEMYSLRENNVDVQIFSLLSPKHEMVHQEAKELEQVAHYSPFVSMTIFAALLHYLVHCPYRLARSLFKTIQQSAHEPATLVRALVLFPKAVAYARQMQEMDIQHVHAHFVWLEGIAAATVAELTGIGFSIHPHAFGLFSRNQKDVKAELENAAKVVTISEYHRDYIARLCPRIRTTDIEIVHCGVDVNRFRPARQRQANDPPRILSVGRLDGKKGYRYLIDACAALQKRGVPFLCEIVGGGQKETVELQQRIDARGLRDQVVLVGPLPQHEIVKRYRASDLFALACVSMPSGDQDGIPVVLMEAMACGLPVVSTKLSGIPELIQDGFNGLLVPQRDVHALADALQDLLGCERRRAGYGAKARASVVEQFEIKKNAARMAAMFRELTAAAPRPAQRRDRSCGNRDPKETDSKVDAE